MLYTKHFIYVTDVGPWCPWLHTVIGLRQCASILQVFWICLYPRLSFRRLRHAEELYALSLCHTLLLCFLLCGKAYGLWEMGNIGKDFVCFYQPCFFSLLFAFSSWNIIRSKAFHEICFAIICSRSLNDTPSHCFFPSHETNGPLCTSIAVISFVSEYLTSWPAFTCSKRSSWGHPFKPITSPLWPIRLFFSGD